MANDLEKRVESLERNQALLMQTLKTACLDGLSWETAVGEILDSFDIRVSEDELVEMFRTFD